MPNDAIIIACAECEYAASLLPIESSELTCDVTYLYCI